MTLGKKLSCYRKLAGLTQQQLGTRLNLSAQAISKWEKDLAEPDLSTLRALAELYKVTIDELLDLENGFQDVAVEDEENGPAEQSETAEQGEPETAAAPSKTIGFCKKCGVVVSEETVGCTEPTVLCKKCMQAYAQEKAAAEKKKRMEAAMAAKRRQVELEIARENLRRKRLTSLIVAALVAGVFLIVGATAVFSDFQPLKLLIVVVLTYAIFSFVCCLFYKGIVRYFAVELVAKAFDLMQTIVFFGQESLLVRVLLLILLTGLILLGIALLVLVVCVTAIFGFLAGLACAPFVFPHQMVKINRCLKGNAV